MKKILFTVLSFLLVYPSVCLGTVRIKNVSQTGSGSTGTIKIELNGKYNASNAKLSYAPERVDITLPDAFVLPVKRVFKSSSAKSSVAKIEAVLMPGKSTRVSVHFRNVPIDVIKKTGDISSDGNSIVFNYSTSLDAKPVDATPETKVNSTVAAAVSVDQTPKTIQDNGDNLNAQKDVAGPKVSEAGENIPTKKFGIAVIWKFIKFMFLIVLVFLFLFTVFYLFRKYSGQISETISRGNRSSTPMNINTGNIRVITSLELSHGKTLHIIEVLGEKMLIASGKESITMLAKLGRVTDEESETLMRSRLKEQLKNI